MESDLGKIYDLMCKNGVICSVCKIGAAYHKAYTADHSGRIQVPAWPPVKEGTQWIGFTCDGSPDKTDVYGARNCGLQGRRIASFPGYWEGPKTAKQAGPECRCHPHLLMVHSEQKNCEWMKAKLAGKEVK